MEKMSFEALLKATGGKQGCKSDVFDPAECFITGVKTDSRKIEPGDLFVAIKGEHFDGNDYIEQVLQKGAAAVFASRSYCDPRVIVVDDTVRALMDAAKVYRKRFYTFTVGVTGSVGKTSTKEMIYAVLSSHHKTLKTLGNHNNEIGMPLTLFELSDSYRYAVIEMGMCNFGEITELSKVAKPNVGVITNIGVSHIEVLGSRENILKAKLEIVNGMSSDAPLILNTDDDLLLQASETLDRPVMTFGIDSPAEITASNLRTKDYLTEFDINAYGQSYHAVIPTIGKHMVYHALAAFAVGLTVDMTPQEIIKGLASFQNPAMRQEIRSVGDCRFVVDCYNASPDSMRAALNVLSELDNGGMGRRIAVLGDMLELGEISEKQHFEIGRYAARSKLDALVCIGDMARHIKRGAVAAGMRSVAWFEDKAEAVKYLEKLLSPQDTVLFKASRGMALEQVIEPLSKTLTAKDE